MCLAMVAKTKDKNKFLKTIPAIKGLKVYRIVKRVRTKHYAGSDTITYKPLFQYNEVKEGLNKADTSIGLGYPPEDYKSGFHSFLTRVDAEKYLISYHEEFGGDTGIVECIVKKSWVTAVGKNYLLWSTDILVPCIVSSKVIIGKLDF